MLRIGGTRFRAGGAVVALATIPLRLVIGVGQLVTLIAVLLAVLIVEARASSRPVST